MTGFVSVTRNMAFSSLSEKDEHSMWRVHGSILCTTHPQDQEAALDARHFILDPVVDRGRKLGASAKARTKSKARVDALANGDWTLAAGGRSGAAAAGGAYCM